MKKQILILLLCCFPFLFSQIPENILRYRNDKRGNILNRKNGLIDGNKIRTVFQNNGEVSSWFDGAVSAPHLEWPKGSGHRHADGFSFFVGAKVKIINTFGQEQFITPIETSYREEMDRDPITGSLWGFEPVAEYSNSGSNLIAISTNPDSWPTIWPEALNLSTDYNSNWYSYFGKGVQDSVVETFYVLDDSQDKEFTRAPYNFFPIHSDSTWGGLGLRVEVRGLQFKTILLQDIIFWNYTITNLSDNNYDSTLFGYFLDPSVGSVLNNAKIDMESKLIYTWAPSGTGLPDNYKTGYLGLATLTSAENKQNTSSMYLSLLQNKGPGSVWPKNDGVIWSVLSQGIKDTLITGANIMIWSATGPFLFSKHSTIRYAIAMVLGDDLQNILKKSFLSTKVYQSNYNISDSTLSVNEGTNNIELSENVSLFQNYPNPFNPSTKIRFHISASQFVILKVYDILGKEIAVLVNEHLPAGEHFAYFRAQEFPSGVYFYSIQAGDFVSSKKLIILK